MGFSIQERVPKGLSWKKTSITHTGRAGHHPAAGREAPQGSHRNSSAWGPIREGTGPLRGPLSSPQAGVQLTEEAGKGRSRPHPPPGTGPSPTSTAQPVNPPPTLPSTFMAAPTPASSGHTVTCGHLLSHCLGHTDPARLSVLTRTVPLQLVDIPSER